MSKERSCPEFGFWYMRCLAHFSSNTYPTNQTTTPRSGLVPHMNQSQPSSNHMQTTPALYQHRGRRRLSWRSTSECESIALHLPGHQDVVWTAHDIESRACTHCTMAMMTITDRSAVIIYQLRMASLSILSFARQCIGSHCNDPILSVDCMHLLCVYLFLSLSLCFGV